MTEGVRLLWIVDSIVRKASGSNARFLGLEHVEGFTGRLLVDSLPEKAANDSLVYYKGDVLFGKLRPYLAKSYLARANATCTPELLVLRPRPAVDARFLCYITRSTPFVEWAVLSSYGSKMPRTSWEALRDYETWLPHVAEQRRIADFLDAETARIDRLVSLRVRQQELIRERVATHLTTLFDHLSETHGCYRLGGFLRRLEQGWSPQCEDRLANDDEYGVLKSGCINGGVFNSAQHKTLPAAEEPRLDLLVRPGDLLVSRASGSLDLIGSAAVVPADAPSNLILCDKVYRLRLLPAAETEFVALMMAAYPIRELIKLGTSGAAGMANNLPSGTIRSLPLPKAPPAEQRAAVQMARSDRTQVDAAVGALGGSIQLLAERRQALITAAVTGQLDVTTARGAA